MSKQIEKKSGFSKYAGYLLLLCFSLFFISFIYQFITSEPIDSTKQWCPTHNTYHDISEQTEGEIWCNNCKTWHAQNDESRTPIIK